MTLSDGLSDDAVRDALVAENARLAELVATADHATPVPTCPGWDLTKLLRHVGRGHRWAATMVATRATEVLDPREVPGGKPPADLDGIVAWLRASARAVPDAVDATGPEVPVWTFTGPKPAAWWIRRRLHEETAHLADAQLALGREVDLAPELGADGLSEWLDLLAARPAEMLPADVTLHLHATDVDGEWTIRPTDTGIAWEPGHAKGTAAVRGPAALLYLALLRRVPLADPRLAVFGEEKAVSAFLDATPF
ncbi:maleylpyruvate isomerase family mycothiol-dependent enzyme [Pseudonocardia xishanensis]|uniref:Maleylpyruvate isomerase family mycothiol-dependent enzyme n=1 Tax=Pseudonocardia xishanensis TaxID=630995 RepID=A0ABP8S230_9PSEU